MPNSVRLLLQLGVIVGAVYGGFYAITTFLEPQPRTISTSIGKIKIP